MKTLPFATTVADSKNENCGFKFDSALIGLLWIAQPLTQILSVYLFLCRCYIISRRNMSEWDSTGNVNERPVLPEQN